MFNADKLLIKAVFNDSKSGFDQLSIIMIIQVEAYRFIATVLVHVIMV